MIDKSIVENKEIEDCLIDIAHEVWAASQLIPGEGIEDAVDRIVDIFKSNEDFVISVRNSTD